jgi:hypothetical protein
MSSKLLILAALLVLPFSAHAASDFDEQGSSKWDMHYFQNCPSANYDVCVDYQVELAKHVGKSDFAKVKRQLEKKIADLETMQKNYGSIFEDQKVKNPEKLFLQNEGISGADQDDQIKTRIRHLLIYAHADLEGVSEAEAHQMLQRVRHLRNILELHTQGGSTVSVQGATARTGGAQ